MRRLIKWLATVGGVGRCPIAPGTAGSGAGMLFAWLSARTLSPLGGVVSVVGLLLLGVYAAGRVASETGNPDPSVVVIDEAVGMWLVCAAVPKVLRVGWLAILAFALFRLFDISKVPPLKRLERVHGGWGIMLDDVGAAVYACLVLRLVLRVLGL